MKSSKVHCSYLPVVALVMVAAFAPLLSSCGGSDPKPTAGEKVLANLVNSPWKMKSVTVDGTDQSALFTGFTITFSKSSTSGGNYSTTNGGVVWPTNGQWTISDINTAGLFTRNDGVEVQLTEVTVTTLNMSLS